MLDAGTAALEGALIGASAGFLGTLANIWHQNHLDGKRRKQDRLEKTYAEILTVVMAVQIRISFAVIRGETAVLRELLDQTVNMVGLSRAFASRDVQDVLRDWSQQVRDTTDLAALPSFEERDKGFREALKSLNDRSLQIAQAVRRELGVD
jgi:hypothetical protein